MRDVPARRFGNVGPWAAGHSIPLAAGLVAVIAVVLYGASSLRGTFEPRSTLGLAFGIAAAASLVVVMLYSVRRAMPAVRALGPSQRYMQIHLWVGALFLVLLLLHTGFGVPSGVLTMTLWVVSLWVVATGAVGLLLQRSLPRVLEPAASFEVHLRRVPELVGDLRRRAEAIAGAGGPRVQAFYEQELAHEMAGPRMLGTELFRPPGSFGRGGREAELLRRTLPEDGVSTLDELRSLHAAKREMDIHFTLQRILRGWLALHLPVAILLLGLVALHVFFTVYF